MASNPVQPDDGADHTPEIDHDYQALLEARRDLRCQLEPLLLYHRHDAQLPFSLSELVVMALMFSDDEYLTTVDIFRWAAANFDCYNRQTLDIAQSIMRDGPGAGWENNLVEMHETFARGFGDYRLDRILEPLKGSSPLCGTISVDAARIHLRKWLEPERKGTFRFLDLPPELRNRIYDMTVTFPDSVIDLARPWWEKHDDGSDEGHFCIAEKDGKYTAHELEFRYAHPKDLLSLSCTCKQLYKEVMTVFYGSNEFSFDVDDLVKFVKRVPFERLRYMKKISLWLFAEKAFCIACDQTHRDALDTLCRAVSLDQLSLTIQSWDWLSTGDIICNDCETPEIRPESPTDVPLWSSVARLASKSKVVVIDNAEKSYHDADELVLVTREFLVAKAGLRLKEMRKGNDPDADESVNEEDLAEVDMEAVYETKVKYEMEEKPKCNEEEAGRM